MSERFGLMPPAGVSKGFSCLNIKFLNNKISGKVPTAMCHTYELKFSFCEKFP